jgi:hypothetical protein
MIISRYTTGKRVLECPDSLTLAVRGGDHPAVPTFFLRNPPRKPSESPAIDSIL